MSDQPLLQSVHRALDVIEALESAPDGVGVTALARQLDLKVSTTHNMLKVLRQRRYVDQVAGTTNYTLGTRLIMLGSRAASKSDLVRAAREPLRVLHQFCGESVFLGVRRHTDLDMLITLQGIRLLSVSSSTKPFSKLHCTAMGKVLIAYMSSEERAYWLAEGGLPALTEYTITDMETLDAELAVVRERGYALNNAEESQGVIGVAAPVWDHRQLVVAGVSVGYPAVSWPDGELPGIIEAITRCAAEISANLGYVSP